MQISSNNKQNRETTHRFSIRTKFFGLSVLVVLVLSGVFVLYFFERQEELYTAALLEELKNHSAMAAFGLGTGVGTENFRVMRQGIRGVKENENFLYLVVVDTLGETVAQDNPKNLPLDLAQLRSFPPVFLEASVVHLRQPVSYGRTPLGTLYIGFSTENLLEKIAEMRASSYVVAGGAIAILFALMWIFGSSITHPLTRITRAAEAIKEGNILQRVEVSSSDEIGVLAQAFNRMSEQLEASYREKDQLIASLRTAMAEVKTLSGLLPICASCKKIRDDRGEWNVLEQYIHDHSDADFTHGLCPECMGEYFPSLKK